MALLNHKIFYNLIFFVLLLADILLLGILLNLKLAEGAYVRPLAEISCDPAHPDPALNRAKAVNHWRVPVNLAVCLVPASEKPVDRQRLLAGFAAELVIYDAQGKELRREKFMPTGTYQVNGKEWPAARFTTALLPQGESTLGIVFIGPQKAWEGLGKARLIAQPYRLSPPKAIQAGLLLAFLASVLLTVIVVRISHRKFNPPPPAEEQTPAA